MTEYFLKFIDGDSGETVDWETSERIPDKDEEYYLYKKNETVTVLDIDKDAGGTYLVKVGT
jgi:hypothetical protein